MKFLRPLLFIVFITVVLISSCQSNKTSEELTQKDAIRINQIGYYPNAIKKAIIADSLKAAKFSVINNNNGETVLEGDLSQTTEWKLAGEKVKIADFSQLKDTGNYALVIQGLGKSYDFSIQENVLEDVFKGSLRGLYYQGVSMPLEKKYAGKWERPLGHPDNQVKFHISSGRDTTETISSPGGWYDAGDYNKYVINAAFPLGQMFLLYEQYPERLHKIDLNIPESGNATSDYLDEMKYEMDWLLTMQDQDGGLFHKLTTKNFEGMVMPHEAVSQRYIVGKGTAATLDFAAVMAQAYRIFNKEDNAYAEECLKRALSAWSWAIKNPNVEFRNPEDIHTGEYGDKNFDDEFYWAAAELYVSTEEKEFLDYLLANEPSYAFRPGESWTAYMRFLGMFSMLNNAERMPGDLVEKLKTNIIASADSLVEATETNPYFQSITDFHWGSNSDVLNASMLMAQAYRITKDKKYLQAVRENTDYVLGKNPMGYSYVTGYGSKTPMFIHHRQSAADSIAEPVPGLLSGGPNSRQNDKEHVDYPANVAPMKSWVDEEPSYASNEICLNWNAPLTYILGFLELESK
ncbi:glycoside hydrolase family 9 protein [Galbibacter mesophilus]|uniref:glycoside hydrolase family 9 protein n=1 Tax=Galbibacter mesophilus TaxID=379069 RepID=UPI00191FC1CD|nr:glycoside hydrolase family 9 protein [Galbibacter mesophilus]MCM5663170.1 glycoside hydrolase family 9 protein [Galbibacter mesophilus]